MQNVSVGDQPTNAHGSKGTQSAERSRTMLPPPAACSLTGALGSHNPTSNYAWPPGDLCCALYSLFPATRCALSSLFPATRTHTTAHAPQLQGLGGCGHRVLGQRGSSSTAQEGHRMFCFLSFRHLHPSSSAWPLAVRGNSTPFFKNA
jgi:hypothetical protein